MVLALPDWLRCMCVFVCSCQRICDQLAAKDILKGFVPAQAGAGAGGGAGSGGGAGAGGVGAGSAKRARTYTGASSTTPSEAAARRASRAQRIKVMSLKAQGNKKQLSL